MLSKPSIVLIHYFSDDEQRENMNYLHSALNLNSNPNSVHGKSNIKFDIKYNPTPSQNSKAKSNLKLETQTITQPDFCKNIISKKKKKFTNQK